MSKNTKASKKNGAPKTIAAPSAAPAPRSNAKMLALIAVSEDAEKLKNWVDNAEKLNDREIGDAAFRRLMSLVPGVEKGTVEHDFWASIHALEFMLTKENGKTTRLSRTRQKIKRVEAVQTLKELTLTRKGSVGFDRLLDRKMPDLTAEAVVLRHPAEFDEAVQAAARERLVGAGVDVGTLHAQSLQSE